MVKHKNPTTSTKSWKQTNVIEAPLTTRNRPSTIWLPTTTPIIPQSDTMDVTNEINLTQSDGTSTVVTVPNANVLQDRDNTKQQEEESILEFSLWTISSMRDRTVTKSTKMERFEKNLLSHLTWELEIKDQQKKFATLTGIACFLE